MSLELVEKAIANLEAGAFQNLSRALVNKKLVDFTCQANGSMIGSTKTTKSHPDCLFIANSSNKYVFVECTTMKKGLEKKLKSDIDDCLNEKETGIPITSIETIIFCYSNGKIPNKYIVEQKQRLSSLGLKLELLSVNKIALDIEDKYPELALEYLGMNLYNSLNILSINEFIKDSNNGLSPSLNKVFSSRDNDIKCLKDAFSKHNIIIIYGKSGVGKSKLGIELLKSIEKDESRIKCIKARGLFDYNDLLRTQTNTDYYLIDDADKFADIKTILSYLNNKKILFTIRDYELPNFISKLDSLETPYLKYELNPFSDESINKIIKDNIGLCGDDFLIQLDELAKGNIRLAFMIAETCKANKNISTLYDSRDIFGKYYERRINKLLSKDKKELILSCIGLVTFLKQVDIKELDQLEDLLKFFHIDNEEFITTINYLEKEEIVSIFEGEIVEMNDQCLSNYLEYYVFLGAKIVRLKKIFIDLFPKYKKYIIEMINQTLNLFFNNEDLIYIKTELKEYWKTYADQKEILKELASAFSSLNPEGALKLLKDTIKENKIDEKWVINSFNSILDIETTLAIKLFKEYILNGALSLDKGERIIVDNYQFDNYDHLRKYIVQDTILSELLKDNVHFKKILTNYCLKLLQFEFKSGTMRGDQFIYSKMNLGNGDNCLYALREKCIKFLLTNNDIFNVFNTYFSYSPQKNNIDLFNSDIASFDKEIMLLKKDEIFETSVYFYSRDIFDYYNLKWEFIYARNKNLIDFLEPIFEEHNDRTVLFEERKIRYENRLIKEIKSNSQLTIERAKKLVMFNYPFSRVQNQIKKFFQFCAMYINPFYLDELFEIVTNSKWLDNNINEICYFVDRFKQVRCFEDVYKLINISVPESCKSIAFEWLFVSLTESEINESTKKLFDEYVDNLDKHPFVYFTPQHWTKICSNNKKLLYICKKALEFEDKGLGNYSLNLIFDGNPKSSLFENLYTEDKDFIERLYLKLLAKENCHFDENGSYLLRIVDNNSNFLIDFLKAILFHCNDIFAGKRIISLRNSKNYLKYGDILFSELININKKGANIFNGKLLMGHIGFDDDEVISANQLSWLDHFFSRYFKDKELIAYLFKCIENFNFDSKLKCISSFLKYNNDLETFKLILNPSFFTFYGSKIPYIKNRISFYERLKEVIPSETCFIDHLSYIDEVIENLKNSIKRTSIDEKKLVNRFNW